MADKPKAKKFWDSDGDNTAQAMKTSGGRIHYLHILNSNTAQAFLQLFDAPAASVTVGTTTPVLTFLIPAGTASTDSAFEQVFSVPIDFSTAITYACTTTRTGNGDPTAGLGVNALYD